MTILPLNADTRQYLSETCADAEDAIAERDPRYTLPECGYGSTNLTPMEQQVQLTPGEVVRATLLKSWICAGMTAHQALARMARMGY